MCPPVCVLVTCDVCFSAWPLSLSSPSPSDRIFPNFFPREEPPGRGRSHYHQQRPGRSPGGGADAIRGHAAADGGALPRLDGSPRPPPLGQRAVGERAGPSEFLPAVLRVPGDTRRLAHGPAQCECQHQCQLHHAKHHVQRSP